MRCTCAYTLRCVQHTYTRIRYTCTASHTCRGRRRPPWLWAGARVSSPSRERTKSTVCRTLRRGGLYISIRVFTLPGRACVCCCFRDDLGYESRIWRVGASEGRAMPRTVAGGTLCREKQRGHDLLGVALGAHAPPVNKQRGGFLFSLFTSSSRRVILHTITIIIIIRSLLYARRALYDLIVLRILLSVLQ